MLRILKIKSKTCKDSEYTHAVDNKDLKLVKN